MAESLLTGKFGAIRLSSDLRWESDDPELVDLANWLVPIEFSESDGDPHKFLISELKEHLGGESIVYGQPPIDSKWTGVDLDGTLAQYDGWQGIEHIGDPIVPMVERVREWIAQGKDVRIFTARVSNPKEREQATKLIQDWTEKYLGSRLPVTNVKDHQMEELWDDRAVAVERNTGEVLNKALSSETDPKARASEMADILLAMFGDDTQALFDNAYPPEPQEIKKLLGAPRVWNEIEHPRGPNGRFINKYSSEAVGAAYKAIETALSIPRSPDSLKHLAENLSILTVSQLKELKKKYGISASGKNKDSLVQKIADRLHRGRSTEQVAEPPKAVDQKQSVADSLFGKGRRGQVSVIGAMRAKIEAGEPVSLLGDKIEGAADLAKLAQIYRDPRYETFRVFFVKANTIVGQTAYSSRMPDVVKMPPDWTDRIKENMSEVGADGFYIMHNHPTGDPSPSREDINTTGRVAEMFGGDVFKGHVIIDHTRSTFLDKDWSSQERRMSIKDFSIENENLNDPAKAPVPHETLGMLIKDPESLAMVAMKIGNDISRPVVIFTNTRGKVTTLADFDKATLEDSEDSKVFGLLRRMGRMGGGNHMKFVVVPDRFANGNSEQWRTIFRKPWVTDIVDLDGRSLNELVGGSQFRGLDRSKYDRGTTSPIVLEEFVNE